MPKIEIYVVDMHIRQYVCSAVGQGQYNTMNNRGLTISQLDNKTSYLLSIFWASPDLEQVVSKMKGNMYGGVGDGQWRIVNNEQKRRYQADHWEMLKELMDEIEYFSLTERDAHRSYG